MAAKKNSKPASSPASKPSRRAETGAKIKSAVQNPKSAGAGMPLKPYKKVTPAQIAANKKAYEKSKTKKVIDIVETFTPLGAVEPFIKGVSGKNPRTGKSVNRLAEFGTAAFYAAPIGGKKVKTAVKAVRRVGQAKSAIGRMGAKQGGRKVGGSFGGRVQ